MTEGPLVHYYARQLAKVLEGKPVDVAFGLKSLKAEEASLRGLSVRTVEAHGKQFRIHLSDGRIILVHLMMWGSWRIYRRGQVWDRPAARARLTLATDAHKAVAFSAPVVKLMEKGALEKDPRWGDTGPDPLRKDFSTPEFMDRLKGRRDCEIGEVLLDQHVIAGLGNILRIEVLHRSRIHPRRLVRDLTEREVAGMLDSIAMLTSAWLGAMGRPEAGLTIYRRSGRACPSCGSTVESFWQAGRITYACPGCQKSAGAGDFRPAADRRDDVGEMESGHR